MRLPLITDSTAAEKEAVGRSCGECKACCVLPRIPQGLPTIESKPGYTPCPHLKTNCSAEGCCSIYPNRPNMCAEYECLWKLGHVAGDERRRPDNLGIMFGVNDIEGRTVIEGWELWPGAASTHPGQWIIESLVKYTSVFLRYYGVPASFQYHNAASLEMGRQLTEWALHNPKELGKWLRDKILRRYITIPKEATETTMTDLEKLEMGIPAIVYLHKK